MKQLELAYWGGRRKGAGRKKTSRYVAHDKRETITPRYPLHINIKLESNVRVCLRTAEIFKAFKKCVRRAKQKGLYVIHYSIIDNHAHMICETANNETLSRGLKSLNGQFAKAIKKLSGSRVKKVLAGRYHLHVLKTPTQVKRALVYLFFNFAKHYKLIEHIDYYSSTGYFRELKTLMKGRLSLLLLDQIHGFRGKPLPEELSPPRSWLAQEGWKRAA